MENAGKTILEKRKTNGKQMERAAVKNRRFAGAEAGSEAAI